MHILGISGSTRVWGNCDAAVKTVLAASAGKGAMIDFVRLTDLKIEACRGCFKCIPERGRCPLDDDLYSLITKTTSSDALVFGIPVYFMAPAASCVALLDRLLTMGNVPVKGKRPGITITVMGNRKWRGIAEPIVNMTASLLGFEVSHSLAIEAQGPGELLLDKANVSQLRHLGRLLAEGRPIQPEEREPLCPVCRSDFFRLSSGGLLCPICATIIDSERYEKAGEVVVHPGETRWGHVWLKKHIMAWIRPSIENYKRRRRDCLKAISELKKIYEESGGN